jgi:hypothetical protein
MFINSATEFLKSIHLFSSYVTNCVRSRISGQKNGKATPLSLLRGKRIAVAALNRFAARTLHESRYNARSTLCRGVNEEASGRHI